MDSSLLVSLRRYRPREGRDSLEDFITEAFCWLLRHSSGVASAVLAHVQGAMPDGQKFDLPGENEEIEWRTQFQLGSRRPDMQASWRGVTLIFEHKVWSAVSESQIRSYRGRALAQYSGAEVRVVAITSSPHERSVEADASLCWRDIYEALAGYSNELGDVAEKVYVDDFLALLAHEGLQPAAPVSHEAVRFFPTVGKLPLQLDEAFRPLEAREWPVSSCYVPRMKGMRWGRIGIEFCRTDVSSEWSPGIFIGCVLDGRDHRIDHRLEDSLKLQLILEFDRGLHRDYPSMSSYQGLKAMLVESAKGTRWAPYDHGQEGKRNPFHALYLETSLLELLRGSTTMEEQRDRIYEAACEALVFLQQDEWFDRLRRECDAAVG